MGIPQAIPPVEDVADPAARAALLAMRTDINALYGLGKDPRQAALLKGEGAEIGIIGFEGSRIFARNVPVRPTVSQAVPATGQSPAIISLSDVFDVATGLAAGTYPMPALVIPAGARVVNAWYDVETALTNAGGATALVIGVPEDFPAGIASGTIATAFTAGLHQASPSNTVASFTGKTTNARVVEVIVVGAALTAGKFRLFIQYANG